MAAGWGLKDQCQEWAFRDKKFPRTSPGVERSDTTQSHLSEERIPSFKADSAGGVLVRRFLHGDVHATESVGALNVGVTASGSIKLCPAWFPSRALVPTHAC